VKVITLYGLDNAIDGIVLDVLLRKHETIRRSLGVAVPVPASSAAVMEAIFEGLLLRGRSATAVNIEQLTLFDEVAAPKRTELLAGWDAAADRERRGSLYAQASLRVEEVSRELAAARAAVGSAPDVARFVRTALAAHGGHMTDAPHGAVDLLLTGTPAGLRDAVGGVTELRARFELPVRNRETYLSRTHPFVEGLASFVLTAALDGLIDSPASRAGVTRTAAVDRRTTLLLVRHRFDVVTIRGNNERVLLAEDTSVLAFAGPPNDPIWLGPDAVAPLLAATPAGNIAAEQAARFLTQVIEAARTIGPALDAEAERRAEELLTAHRRVRTEAGVRGVRYRVIAHTPPDVLGVYILLPPLAAP
jgi:hypothetical protein